MNSHATGITVEQEADAPLLASPHRLDVRVRMLDLHLRRGVLGGRYHRRTAHPDFVARSVDTDHQVRPRSGMHSHGCVIPSIRHRSKRTQRFRLLMQCSGGVVHSTPGRHLHELRMCRNWFAVHRSELPGKGILQPPDARLGRDPLARLVREGNSLKDVAAAGGWKDTETLLTCYQQPDTDTLLAVMSEPRKVRDAALASSR